MEEETDDDSVKAEDLTVSTQTILDNLIAANGSNIVYGINTPFSWPSAAHIPTAAAAATYPSYTYSNYTTAATNSSMSGGLKVSGDADFEGDVKIKGHSILKTLETIEKRLAILQPDPKKLAKYEALQKAYEHYKLLEALCSSDDDNG